MDDPIAMIRDQITGKLGMFDPEVFGPAFNTLVQVFSVDNSIVGEGFDISGGNRTRNRNRKKRKTVKGGDKYVKYGTILIICVVTIISFCTETRRVDEILQLFQQNRDRVMTEIILPFITYLTEQNPVKGTVGATLVATITSGSLIPTLNGLYGKFVTMLTGDIVVSGQLISLCTNFDKYFISTSVKKDDKQKEVDNLKRLSENVVASLENTNPETTPEISAMEFTYNLPPGSKIVTPSRLNV
jgi:hypothetical protein